MSTKAKKEEILKELKQETKDSEIVVFVNFHGLATSSAQEVRNLMRGADARYFVAKKTLIKKAFEDFKFSGDMPELEGEIALVFCKKDIVAPVKSLFNFSKKHKEIVFAGGIMDKFFISGADVSRLAKLPSREILLAQFVNIINAPRQQMVGVLQAPIRDFISVLKQINK